MARTFVSAWSVELTKLAQAGLDQSVLLSYVASAPGTFNLDSEAIIYLRDLGVSSDVISAILEHDQELTSGFREAPASTVPDSFSRLDSWLSTNSPANSASQPPASATPVAAAPAQVIPLPSVPMASAATDTTDAAIPSVAAPPQAGTNPLSTCYRQVAPSKPTPETYPVRKPYAVPLTSPIVFYRAETRVPNRLILVMFP